MYQIYACVYEGEEEFIRDWGGVCFITDEKKLSEMMENQWRCYLLGPLSEIRSIETIVNLND